MSEKTILDRHLRMPLESRGLGYGSSGIEIGLHPIAAIAEEFGTPFYLFDEERLRSNARGAVQTARSVFSQVDLFYSMKTNPLRRVLEVVRGEGIGAEVISFWEATEALASGFALPDIVFNGPAKRNADLQWAAQHGVLVQLESPDEAEALVRASQSSGFQVRAGIRINPDVAEPDAHQDLRMGARGSVFGLDPEGEAFRETVALLQTAPNVKLISLSAHIGTGITTTEPFRCLARILSRTRKRLASEGTEIPVLDFGGGYGVPYEIRYPHSIFGTAQDRSADGCDVPSPDEVTSFHKVCEVIRSELIADPPVKCMMEPGRLIVSDAFHLVTRVIRTKRDGRGPVALVDAGRMQNALFVSRGYHDIVPALAGEGDWSPWCIAGPLCANFDLYTESRPMPALREGDLIVVLDVGAYNLSARSQWSFPSAPVVSVNGKSVGYVDS